MEEILKVDHLKASYGRESILKDISFGVKRGEIRMVLGSSGCGKSTLLNMIAGILSPENGEIVITNCDISVEYPKYKNDIDDIVRTSAGVGIYWNTPMGPMNFSWGWPLRMTSYDREQRFLLSFETQF